MATREDHHFCSDSCRKNFHRTGFSWPKIRAMVQQEIEAAERRIRRYVAIEALRARQMRSPQKFLEAIESLLKGEHRQDDVSRVDGVPPDGHL
jgi:hypothetical protein